MIKKILFVYFALMVAAVLNAAKLGTLTDILAPRCITMDQTSLYISDQNSIFVYSIDGLRLQRRFCRQGLGPGEFRATPQINVYPDGVLAFIGLKFVLFSKNGEILKEKTISSIIVDMGMVGERYVLQRTGVLGHENATNMIYIEILDKELTRVKIPLKKDFTRKRSGKKKIRYLVNPIFRFRCYSDKIYVVDGRKGFSIEIFDKNGEPAGTIKKEYPKIKIDEDSKVKRMAEYRSLPQVKKRWHLFKENFDYRFPEYFPAIKDFYVEDGKIYVITYLEKDGKEQYRVLSIDGELLKSVFLPQCKRAMFVIRNNHFYYLYENEDLEEWEIHSVKIE